MFTVYIIESANFIFTLIYDSNLEKLQVMLTLPNLIHIMALIEKTVDSCSLSKLLGRGITGEVYQSTLEGQPMAFKRFFSLDCPSYRSEVKYYSILRQQSNILQMLGHKDYSETDSKHVVGPYILLELADSNTIYDSLEEHGFFPSNIARNFARQLMSGVKAMHHLDIAHRDIKLDNCLLTADFTLKIGDLGYASSEKEGQEQLGTRGYMAPEISLGRMYDLKKADIFACGVMIFILNVGLPPFNNPRDKFYRLIKEKNFSAFWRIFRKAPGASNITDEFRDMMERMLAADPIQRPSAAQVGELGWFAGPVASQWEVVDYMNGASIPVQCVQQLSLEVLNL